MLTTKNLTLTQKFLGRKMKWKTANVTMFFDLSTLRLLIYSIDDH